jgi:DNA-binding NarL/FixJ family response regulator
MVLMLSMHSESTFVRTCLEAGARGYLLKNALDLELAEAVKRVAGGAIVLDPRLEKLSSDPEESRPALTTRELEVLQLIVHGKSSKDIAAILGISANTIAVHRTNLMQTLGIHNTAELVVYAIRNGLANIS